MVIFSKKNDDVWVIPKRDLQAVHWDLQETLSDSELLGPHIGTSNCVAYVPIVVCSNVRISTLL